MKVSTRIFLTSLAILFLAGLLSSTYIIREVTGLTSFSLGLFDQIEVFALPKEPKRYGYIEKDNNGKFNVATKLTRADVANMIFKIENLEYGYDNIFKDTEDNEFAYIISSVVKCGYMSDYDGEFMPDNYLTRSRFMKIINDIIKIDNLKLNKVREYQNEYFDIEKDENKKYIINAYQYGLVDSNANAKFRPDDFLTKEEAIVILNKVYGYNNGDYLHMLGAYSEDPYVDINQEYWAFTDIVKATVGLEK